MAKSGLEKKDYDFIATGFKVESFFTQNAGRKHFASVFIPEG